MKISYLGNLTSTFLLLTSFFCVQSAPARPLNERSTEFAWVLLEEQQSDSSPRRKITPKSIFISPAFGAQSCSTGYTLDANGRCVKVVKLDTSAHEQFVLELLNQNFGNYEDYDDEGGEIGDEALPTPGPFQFNIPLGMDTEKDKISIIVAPTNGNFEDTMKLEDTMKHVDKKTSPLDAPLIITNINIRDDSDASGSHQNQNLTRVQTNETTTSPVLTTTTRTTIRETRPDEINLPTSTIPTTIYDDPTTITTEPTDMTTILDKGQDELLAESQEPQAIFFKLPDSASGESTTLSESEDSQTLPTTTHANNIRFPDRPAFDEALFQDFLQDMKKQVNRRFVTKTSAPTSSEDALYTNHRNRDRWLFPRFLEDQRRARR